MRVSEKTLELNIGAEMLLKLRRQLSNSKIYLRGLTQAEEREDGVDSFVCIDKYSEILAFQFKRPYRNEEMEPYCYRIQKDQHEALYDLAINNPNKIFYVFPFYSQYDKFILKLPDLMSETRMLDINLMKDTDLFNTKKTRSVKCFKKIAVINPEYPLINMNDPEIISNIFKRGIPMDSFISWYKKYCFDSNNAEKRRNPHLFRGLKVYVIRN